MTVNLGPTFLSGALAANAGAVMDEPSCPLVQAIFDGPINDDLSDGSYTIHTIYILYNHVVVENRFNSYAFILHINR